MTTLKPIPVILCGKTATIGKPVSELLLPEYEVIHFIQSFEAAQSDIPRLLAGEEPQASASSEVGTQNYTRPPRAVILGRAYSPEQVDELRNLCEGRAKEAVAWLVGDPAKAPSGNQPPGPDYAEIAASLVKSALAAWRVDGGDEVIWY